MPHTGPAQQNHAVRSAQALHYCPPRPLPGWLTSTLWYGACALAGILLGVQW
jgi:hypothetical protein